MCNPLICTIKHIKERGIMEKIRFNHCNGRIFDDYDYEEMERNDAHGFVELFDLMICMNLIHLRKVELLEDNIVLIQTPYDNTPNNSGLFYTLASRKDCILAMDYFMEIKKNEDNYDWE